jgi:hypothetical protein
MWVRALCGVLIDLGVPRNVALAKAECARADFAIFN